MSDQARGDSLIAQGQQAVRDFLSADLELAFTMLKTAEIDAPTDPDHSRILLTTVEAALATVRSFEPRIINHEEWTAISARADELEAAIENFKDTYSGVLARGN
jgi:hypothetical protein